MKKNRKLLGYLMGRKLYLEGEPNDYNFDSAVDRGLEALSGVQYIYFTDYPDGHHPMFFEKYPELEKCKK